MKTKLFIAFIALVMAMPGSAEAQVSKFLKKIGQEATKNAADEKSEEKKSGINPGRALMGLLGGGEEVIHEENYVFTGSFIMEMTAYDDEDNNADAVINYNTYINSSNENLAIEVIPVEGEATTTGVSVMTIIYDRGNQCALMLSEQGDQKTAIATGLDEESLDVDDSEELPEENYSYSKTGRTKTIAGYRCEEYIMKDEESTVNAWVTRDADFMLGQKEMKKAGMPVYYGSEIEGGMIMEMDVFKDDQRQMNMVVKEVNLNSGKTFSMQGYMIMNVNSNPEK